MKIAIQQLQLGRILTSEKKAKNALDTISNAGFNAIELNGFMIRKNPFIVKILTELGGMPVKKSDTLDWKKLVKDTNLEVASIHEDINTLETNINLVIKEAKEYNTKFIVLTGNYKFDYSNEKVIDDLASRLNTIGKNLKEENIEFLYHNHNVEFRHINDKELAYDRLIDKTEKQYVNFEFDSYWPSVSGVDALSYMKKLGNRIRLHHICDNGNIQKGESITPIVKMKAVELGLGCLNLNDMIDQDYKNNTEYVILEQHKNHIDNNPLKSALLSLNYLKAKVKN